MSVKEIENRVVVAIDGNKDDSKTFVRLSRNLGYKVEKVNPLALDIKMATSVVPKNHAEYPFIERAIHEFRKEKNLHYWFISNRIENSDADVIILVNVPTVTMPQVKEDFCAFSVYVGSGSGYSENRHDYNLVDVNKESVERILRILSE